MRVGAPAAARAGPGDRGPQAPPAPPRPRLAPRRHRRLPPRPPSRPPRSTASAPGDVLEITVFGNERPDPTPTVQPSGVIALPLLGEVPVAGLTVAEIQRKLTTLLARDFLVNPQVEVKVKEYQSQFVTVVGEVNSPGPQAAARPHPPHRRAAGGGRASRPGLRRGHHHPRGGDLRRRRDDAAAALRGAQRPDAPGPDQPGARLRNGDIITASPKYYVTVEGEVTRPGRYPIEGDLTVTRRHLHGGRPHPLREQRREGPAHRPADRATTILEVDLKDVRNGKKPDPPLLPNDVVTVSRRLF